NQRRCWERAGEGGQFEHSQGGLHGRAGLRGGDFERHGERYQQICRQHSIDYYPALLVGTSALCATALVTYHVSGGGGSDSSDRRAPFWHAKRGERWF